MSSDSHNPEENSSAEPGHEASDAYLAKRKSDPARTEMVSLPESGAIRSNRGTIEMVIQKNGRTLTPDYTPTGILKSVHTSDGLKFVMTPDKKTWCILDRCGEQVNKEPIKSVFFDKKGNFVYVAEGGKRTTMYLDGTTTEE